MNKEQEKSNVLEKITFYLGLLVLISLIGYLSFQLTKQENKPPSLEVRTSYDPAMDNYGFKVEVENKGQETAQSTNIQFELYQEGKVAGKATLEIDFVPVRSKESGWIVFNQKRKGSDSLVISSMTFLKP